MRTQGLITPAMMLYVGGVGIIGYILYKKFLKEATPRNAR